MSFHRPPGGPADRPYDSLGRPTARPESRPAGGGAPSAWPWSPPGGPEPPPYARSNRRRSRRGTIAVALTAVLTLLVAGGAFAFFSLDPFHVFRPGPQPAEAVPANALAYVSVDLDPMAGQKIDALRFLNAFPGFHDNAGVTDPTTDVRKVVLTWALKSQHCTSVHYARDVSPWLGERIGTALMPPTPRNKDRELVVVQVSDQAAARRGVAAIDRCVAATSPDARPTGVAFSHGFMLLTPFQSQADAYARSAATASLADDEQFKADMASLGDPGIISAWVDVKGLFRSLEPGLFANQSFRAGLSTTQRIAATFRFRSDAVEIEASTYGNNIPVAHGYNPIIRLPDSTVFAFSESGADQRVGRLWNQTLAQARSQDPGIDRQIQRVQEQTGLVLPDDLRTLLGQNLLLSLDSRGLSSSSFDHPSRLSFGARFTNDPKKLNALYARVIRLLGQGHAVHLPLVKKTFADGITIASNPRYAEQLGRLDGSLGDSSAFTSVVSDASSKELVMYLDIDAVKGRLLRELRSEGAPQDVIDNLRPLRAFGVSADVVGHYQQLTMRLSIDH